MSRQAKPRQSRNNKGQGGSTLAGVMVGLLIGIIVAVAIAVYINFGPKPFTIKGPSDAASAPVATPVQPSMSGPIALPGKPGDAPVEKPRFDFYKILPGGDSSAPAPAPTPAPTQQADTSERVYLQLGAFQDPAEADNLKARLAFMGFEASVQRVDTDKGVLQRVRIGPYASSQDADSVRAKLAQEGIESSVVRSKPRAAGASASAAH
ncbi:SPOR domain-containing protein [Uliginosibacterium sp. sgz301328]|uniref:SPOR domain-containing protein n=1 Tax=Uliginosibacterium sp. sgz301328 TaxID=3243764 RepID=UPI00359D8D68